MNEIFKLAGSELKTSKNHLSIIKPIFKGAKEKN